MILKKHKPIFLVIAAILLATIWELSKSDLKEKQKDDAVVSADTYVPDGYVLVPIQVENTEALEAILGSFGVVDLFLPPLNPKETAKLIASQVKILRAPLDPRKFAVLVPAHESSKLVRLNSSVFVTIHNPKKKKTVFVKEARANTQIQYEQ